MKDDTYVRLRAFEWLLGGMCFAIGFLVIAIPAIMMTLLVLR